MTIPTAEPVCRRCGKTKAQHRHIPGYGLGCYPGEWLCWLDPLPADPPTPPASVPERWDRLNICNGPHNFEGAEFYECGPIDSLLAEQAATIQQFTLELQEYKDILEETSGDL